MTQSIKTVRVRITGRVQGVWYRGWTVREAGRLGLDGWVRNCAGGSVEALLSGPGEIVDEMIQNCWKGPTGARVETVEVTNSSEIPESGFHQAPTV